MASSTSRKSPPAPGDAHRPPTDLENPPAGSLSAKSASALAKPTSSERSELAHPASVPAQLQGESDQAYRRFLAWLASSAVGGKRSIARVASAEGIGERALREQSERYDWRGRAAQLDAKLLERELTAGMGVQRRAVVAQVGLAERLTKVVEDAVAELEGLHGDAALEALGPALEAAKALQRAQAALRLATGQSTSNAHVEIFTKGAAETPRDLDKLSPTQVELLTALEALDAISRGASEIELHPYQLSKLRHVERLIEAHPHRVGTDYIPNAVSEGE